MSTPPPSDPRQLGLATLAASAVAALVLVVAVLPAEYGLDPTGLGGAIGFSKLSEDPSPPSAVVEEDDGPIPLYELQTTWRLVTLPLAQTNGHLTTTQTQELVTIPLSIANITSVTARLEWNDTDLIGGEITEGDTFEISIRGPGGLRSQLVSAKNEPGQPANVSATLNVMSVPFPQENGTSGIHIPTAEDTRGVGNWTFVVRLYSAGGVAGNEDKDPGNDWTLIVSGEAYEADIKKRAEREGDRVRITLAPKQGIEYKFIMSPNATMTYAWTSTAPAYWDLHAEEQGHSTDDFKRYAEGTSAGEEGTLTAPFEGRHGWFWRNDGTAPITITLETRGEYTILGVPR